MRTVVAHHEVLKIGLAGHVTETGFEHLIQQQSVVAAPGYVAGSLGLGGLFFIQEKAKVVGGGRFVGRKACVLDLQV